MASASILLLDWERSAYERVHGRVSSSELLKAIVEDPQFAWLRPISSLIVRIDETVDAEPQDGGVDIEPLAARAREVTAADEARGPHAQRYHTALQEHPDAVFAHRDVTNVLKARGS